MPEESDDPEFLYSRALEAATRETPDFALATIWLREAAGRGSADATYALASWHLHGKHPYVEQDFGEAARLLGIAAEAGIPDAMHDLAISYEKGKGVPKDERAAFENYIRAAIRGHAEAIFDVGRCYFWGIGVSADRSIAKAWLDRAEELGTYESEDVTQLDPDGL